MSIRKHAVSIRMAEFCPGCDYFRFNATATSFVSYDDHYPSNSSSIAAPSRPDISPTCAASTAYLYTEQITRPTSPDSDKLVDELKILQMSRVYQQNLSKMRRRRWRPIEHCVFCRNNLEPEAVYNSHTLKDFQQKITCPILRAYTCPICGATGDGAHTIKYCPYKARKPQTPSPPLQLSWISSPLSPIT